MSRGRCSQGEGTGGAQLPPEIKPSSLYSLVKFVNLTSQLHHSLVMHSLLRKILELFTVCSLHVLTSSGWGGRRNWRRWQLPWSGRNEGTVPDECNSLSFICTIALLVKDYSWLLACEETKASVNYQTPNYCYFILNWNLTQEKHQLHVTVSVLWISVTVECNSSFFKAAFHLFWLLGSICPFLAECRGLMCLGGGN